MYETIREKTEKPSRFDVIAEVEKFNPYHDSRGRFSSAGGATSFTYAPGKSRAHDLAIERAKERAAAGANAGKRIEDAEGSMRGVLRDGAEVRLTGVDPDVAERTVESVKMVIDKYPIAREGIAGIVSDGPDADIFKDSPTSMACFDNGTQKIHLNTSYYGSKAEFDQKYQASVEKKFHPEGTTSESVIVHEMGHAIDRAVSLQSFGEYSYYYKGDTISRRMWNNDLKNAAKKGTPITGEIMTNGLSKYAGAKPAEYFAEGFAEGMTSSAPRPMAKSIMSRLNTYVKKAGGN